ncbi:MAG: signal peptidase I [Solirubrobacterales bacterium]
MPFPYLNVLRQLTIGSRWAMGAFLSTLLAAAVLPVALGMHTCVVRSGSMEPTIDTGDLVISRSISPSEASVGEIVTFKDPDEGGRLITHRVRAMHERDGRFYFLTRGDANTGFEHWNLPSSATLGTVAYRIPKLGYLTGPVASGLGHLLFVVLPAVLLCAIGLRRIWAPERLGKPEAASR